MGLIRLMLAGLCMAALVGCGDVEAVQYRIIKDETVRNVKRTVEVELPERVSAADLSLLASRIYRSGYDRTFIGYRLRGSASGNGYWATTNYTPELNVAIMGSTKEAHDKLLAVPVVTHGDSLGIWLVDMGYEWKTAIYEIEGHFFMKQIYSNGNEKVEPLAVSDHRGLVRYQSESGVDHGEYYVINTAGELEHWGRNGRFNTSKPI